MMYRAWDIEVNLRGLIAGVVISTTLTACTADNSDPVRSQQTFRRESVCVYMASNDAGRLSGTPASLDDIVNEFRKLNSDRIVISDRNLYSDYIRGHGSEALIPELLQRGLERSHIINIASPVSEAYLWNINICPARHFRAIEDIGPPNSPAAIQFRIGNADLSLPIQHLHSSYWIDIPTGRIERTNVRMRFRWLNHSLQSEIPSTACYRRRDDECGEILNIEIRPFRGAPHTPIDPRPYIIDTWHTPEYFVSCAQLRLRIPNQIAMPGTARCALLFTRPPHLGVSFNVPDIFFPARHRLADAIAQQIGDYIE